MSAAGGSDALVVVGSGPGGLEAVRAFRRHDDERPVVLVSADAHPPYSRPALTKDYLTGEAEWADLWLTDDRWFDDHAVELRLGSRVTELDRTARRVVLGDGTSLTYDQLVLATGSRAQPLPIPGGDDRRLILIRDLRSGEQLRGLLEQPEQRVLVIGSGFIGCEAAANLARRGLEVCMITDESVPHERRLGLDVGRRIADWLRDDGVQVLSGSGVARIERGRTGWRVQCKNGTWVDGDTVICGGGARPNTEIAEQSGIRTEHGGLPTDASLRCTADRRVFAVGDIAYAHNASADRAIRVEHWGDAETHGAVAGAVAAGQSRTWTSAPGFWSTIGGRTLKYTSWGDGFDEYRLVDGADGAWTVWYGCNSQLAGVLSVGDDEAYARGREQLEAGTAFPDAG